MALWGGPQRGRLGHRAPGASLSGSRRGRHHPRPSLRKFGKAGAAPLPRNPRGLCSRISSSVEHLFHRNSPTSPQSLGHPKVNKSLPLPHLHGGSRTAEGTGLSPGTQPQAEPQPRLADPQGRTGRLWAARKRHGTQGGFQGRGEGPGFPPPSLRSPALLSVGNSGSLGRLGRRPQVPGPLSAWDVQAHGDVLAQVVAIEMTRACPHRRGVHTERSSWVGGPQGWRKEAEGRRGAPEQRRESPGRVREQSEGHTLLLGGDPG